MDCDVAYSRYRFVNDERDTAYQVFYWENGKLYRAYLEGGNVRTDEFIYLHFQKKHPVNRVADIDCPSFTCSRRNFGKSSRAPWRAGSERAVRLPGGRGGTGGEKGLH